MFELNADIAKGMQFYALSSELQLFIYCIVCILYAQNNSKYNVLKLIFWKILFYFMTTET